MKQRNPYINFDKRRVNVSVELTHYKPLKLSTIVEQIKERRHIIKASQPEKHNENILTRIIK